MKIKYTQLKILIVEDDEDDYIILKELLHDAVGDVEAVEWAESFAHAQKMILAKPFDFYFIDNRLGAELGLGLIVKVKQQFETAPPIIMLSGVDDHKTDIEAMDKGADDYLIKSQLNRHLLERTIRYTLKSKSLEEKLAKLAHFDGLTGLYNRSIFNELLSKTIEQSYRNDQKFALVTIDLDNFKFINDNYGHPAGDQLLTKVARRLKRATRSTDLVARIGGDEFSIILKDVSHNSVFVKLVENIIKIFQEPFQIDSKPITATISVGIAIYPTDTRKGSELIDHSDRAMYQAKNQGKNTYSFYNYRLHEEAKIKHELEMKLGKAIRKNELILYYQPIIALDDESVVSYEALLRWPDDQGGFYNTEEFIGIAEEGRLILDIGNWVFKQACFQVIQWHEQGRTNQKVSINVSANQFESDDFTELVIKHYKANPLISKQLVFEITERKPLDVRQSLIDKLEMLASFGFQFSVDDFGAGHSSIAYLRAFPMNIIKIDKSITENILTSNEDLALCTAIIALGKALSLDVIAEGVETEDIVVKLKAISCPHVQGYYYSRPVPISVINMNSIYPLKTEQG